jgi:hypothetical protein
MSLTTVSVSLRRVIRLSQWFITLCLWPYCISITKKSDTSITVIYHTMSLTTVSVSLRRMIRLSQWFITLCLRLLFSEWYVYHSDLSCYVSDYCISITKKSDTSIAVIYHAMSLTVPFSEWYVYHSDLSRCVSDCTVSVSLRRVIRLSQWFITLCLWLYCISITKKSDTSITVIYHSMSLTVLYQYH